MSNDYLKLADYIKQNNNEYTFLMNQYEEMINKLDCENFSLEFLITLIEKYENYETEYSTVNKQKNKFIKKVIKNIYYKIDMDYNTLDTKTLVNCFFFLNKQFNIQNYPKLTKNLNKCLKNIFNILIKRGKRYFLEKQTGYSINISEEVEFFFKQYNVVILKKIRNSDTNQVYNFIERKNSILETERLDKQLQEYFK